jgi:hypothetical protein
MDRSVYSLVLLDDVVDAVDKMAYERNTNRSNLINQILAEYLSCPTPEMRIKDIFDYVEQTMTGIEHFQMRFQSSDKMVSIRSALKYRYNPTIRYVLELYRVCEPTVGELRVSLRTQSLPLITVLTEFFEFWAKLENKYIGFRFPSGKVFCQIESGRYVRQFLSPNEDELCTSEAIANAISEYIRVFDICLKQYFAELDDLNTTALAINEEYQNFIKHGVII